MIRAAEYPIEKILPLIGSPTSVELDGDRVSVSSLRMRCFKESGLVCVRCGLVGMKFAKEKSHPKESGYHLNLYAADFDGREVLMTHDHIVPRSKGGANHISNVQTMCAPCNSKKGNGSLRAVKRWMTGVEQIDTILGNIFNTVEKSGTLRVEDLDTLTKHVRDTMVDSIIPKALKPVTIGQRPADFDPHNTRVVEIAPNVVIAHDTEDPTQDCRRFYILNVRTGERLCITLTNVEVICSS